MIDLKKIIGLFSLISILIFSACNSQEDVIQDGTIGNSVGNIKNGGYIVKYKDDYLYTNSLDYDHLYIVDQEGKNYSVAGGHYYYEMNLYGDDIYYTSGAPGWIWKFSIENKTNKIIVMDLASNLIVSNNRMFYIRSRDNDWGKLYSCNLNGKDRRLLAENVGNFCVDHGMIFYCDSENNNSLTCMQVNGEEKRKINSSYARDINATDRFLVYFDHNREDKMFRLDLEDETEECISANACWNLNLSDGWVYYRNQTEHGNLYRIHCESGEEQKIADGNIVDINVIGNNVYFRRVIVAEDGHPVGYYKFDLENWEEEEWLIEEWRRGNS